MFDIKIKDWDFLKRCEGCDLYADGKCKKYGGNLKASPSTRGWLYPYELIDKDAGFISEYKMCRKSSIFGNKYIGLTLDDIERIKNGEILHIPGEYGTFIGLVDKEGEG